MKKSVIPFEVILVKSYGDLTIGKIYKVEVIETNNEDKFYKLKNKEGFIHESFFINNYENK